MYSPALTLLVVRTMDRADKYFVSSHPISGLINYRSSEAGLSYPNGVEIEDHGVAGNFSKMLKSRLEVRTKQREEVRAYTAREYHRSVVTDVTAELSEIVVDIKEKLIKDMEEAMGKINPHDLRKILADRSAERIEKLQFKETSRFDSLRFLALREPNRFGNLDWEDPCAVEAANEYDKLYEELQTLNRDYLGFVRVFELCDGDNVLQKALTRPQVATRGDLSPASSSSAVGRSPTPMAAQVMDDPRPKLSEILDKAKLTRKDRKEASYKLKRYRRCGGEDSDAQVDTD
jgi:hypothetical protein